MTEHRQRQGWSKLAVLKYRQAGLTEWSTGVMCHETWFKPGSYTISVTQNPAVAAHVQRKVNYAYDHLPWWMRVERQYHSKGEYLEFNRKDERQRQADPGMASVFLTTHAAAEGGVAVGRTTRNLHMSELCWWGNSQIYTSDIEPTLNAADTNAIAESTGLTQAGIWYSWIQDLLDYPEENDYTLVFIPPYHVKKFSLPLKSNFKLTDEEISIKDRVKREENFDIPDEFLNWRRFRMRNAIKKDGHPYAFISAFPLWPQEAFQTSALGAFPRHKLDEQMAKYVSKPSWHGEIAFGGLNGSPRLMIEDVDPAWTLPKREKFNRLHIWKKPDPKAAYYLAADASRGKEGDDFGYAAVYKANSGNNPDELVADWSGWEEPTEFAGILYALGSYYNKCEVSIEYAKEGMIVADAIVRLEYPSLWRVRRSDVVGAAISRILHFSPTFKTKRAIITTMREALLTDTVIIRSALAISQMYKFVAVSFDANDQPIGYGGEGDNDDAVIGNCQALYCLRQSMPELRAFTEADAQDSKGTKTHSARPSGPAILYAIYDDMTRFRAQTPDLEKAQAAIKNKPGWSIRPVQVTRVNTAYSPIYHGTGPESRMLREGIDQFEINPVTVGAYRVARSYDAEMARGGSGTEGDEWDAMVSGEQWQYGRD